MQYQEAFQRYEKKYLLEESQYLALTKMLGYKMKQDQYGLHTICNLYFDTDTFDLIRKSIEKPVYKEKLRLRSYGVPQKNSTVFLELKKKLKGVVYKRRAPFTLAQASQYIRTGEIPMPQSQILREIDWFRQRYQPQPKVFLAYDRLALYGTDQPELRITFDDNIRWRDSCLDLSKGDWGREILTPGTILMEIKIPGTMPVWLSHILSELGAFPTSFSKYGECYKQNLSCQVQGGIICA